MHFSLFTAQGLSQHTYNLWRSFLTFIQIIFYNIQILPFTIFTLFIQYYLSDTPLNSSSVQADGNFTKHNTHTVGRSQNGWSAEHCNLSTVKRPELAQTSHFRAMIAGTQNTHAVSPGFWFLPYRDATEKPPPHKSQSVSPQPGTAAQERGGRCPASKPRAPAGCSYRQHVRAPLVLRRAAKGSERRQRRCGAEGEQSGQGAS